MAITTIIYLPHASQKLLFSSLDIVRMPNGGEYLFLAKDDEEMNIWINKINTTTKYASTSSLSGKGAQGESQTMPAPDTGES